MEAFYPLADEAELSVREVEYHHGILRENLPV